MGAAALLSIYCAIQHITQTMSQ